MARRAARAYRGNSYRRRTAILTRQRRRKGSVSGRPKLHQTRSIEVGASAPAVTDVFAADDVQQPVTFKLVYEISGTPSGTILNVGNGNPALTVYYSAGTLMFAIGSGSDGDQVAYGTAIRAHTGGRIELVIAVRPGDGAVWVWDQCGPLAFTSSVDEVFTAWSGTSGSDTIIAFANPGSAANNLITNPGAPSNITQLGPVDVFAEYVPHQFLELGPGSAPPTMTSEFLFRATYINNQLALYPLLDDSV